MDRLRDLHLASKTLSTKVEPSRADYVVKHEVPANRNVDMLARLIKMPAPEPEIVCLAAAFCYGSIDRALFGIVDWPSRIIRAVESRCDVRVTASVNLLKNNGPLGRLGLLDALIPSRSDVSFDDLLVLSTEVESRLGLPHDDEPSMARTFLLPLALPKATLPVA